MIDFYIREEVSACFFFSSLHFIHIILEDSWESTFWRLNKLDSLKELEGSDSREIDITARSNLDQSPGHVYLPSFMRYYHVWIMDLQPCFI
ncbi:hypothetical protein E2320_002866, partial [Naja naja]